MHLPCGEAIHQVLHWLHKLSDPEILALVLITPKRLRVTRQHPVNNADFQLQLKTRRDDLEFDLRSRAENCPSFSCLTFGGLNVIGAAKKIASEIHASTRAFCQLPNRKQAICGDNTDTEPMGAHQKLVAIKRECARRRLEASHQRPPPQCGAENECDLSGDAHARRRTNNTDAPRHEDDALRCCATMPDDKRQIPAPPT
jgi:hypothetical protein